MLIRKVKEFSSCNYCEWFIWCKGDFLWFFCLYFYFMIFFFSVYLVINFYYLVYVIVLFGVVFGFLSKIFLILLWKFIKVNFCRFIM